MFGVFGVANTGIASFWREFQETVGEDRWATFKPAVVMFDHHEEDILAMKGILLVPTVSRFLKIKDALERRPVIPIVFDTAINLEYIPSIEVFDVADKVQSHKFVFKPIDYNHVLQSILDAKTEKKHVAVTEEDIRLIPRLLESTQSSILSPILNYVYTLKDMNQRHLAQTALFRWIREGDIESQPELPASKSAKRLLAFLSDDTTRNLIKAVQDMVKGGAPDKLAKKYGVAAFDLRYVRAQFTKLGIN